MVVRRMGFDDAHQFVLAQSLAEYVERWAFALRTGLLAFEPKCGWDPTIPMTAETAKWDRLL